MASRNHHKPRWIRRLAIGRRLLDRAVARLARGASVPENSGVILVAGIIGILAGLGAVVLRELIAFFQRAGYGIAGPSIEQIAALPFWMKLLIPTAGGLGVGVITHFFAPEARGHGVPEVMEAVAIKGGLIRRRVAVAKTLASALTIATGGSTGREGPIVQIGASVGSTLGRALRVSARRTKVYVACGAAAGIAAAFNAPMAGAIFSAEVILADFGVPRLAPIVVASVASTTVSRLIMGHETAFLVPAYELRSAWEFLPYLVLGLLCGLGAIAFIRTLYATEDLFERTRIPIIVRPAVGGLFIGAFSLVVPQILGTGYEGISGALLSEGTWYLLIGLAVAKLLATSVTLGSGGSGGIFAPSLFLGASLGGSWGHLVHQWFPNITAQPGAYALVGMGALVAAATHAPITAILILFEMTGDYNIILPLMFACVGSVAFSTWMSKDSIYTLKLRRRGLDIRAGRDQNMLRSHTVSEILSDEAEVLSPEATMREMMARVVESLHPQFFVVDARGRLEGIIQAAEIRQVLFDPTLADIVIARDLLQPPEGHLYPDDTLDQAMRLFGTSSREEVPVLERDSGDRFLGVATRENCIRSYNRAIARADVAGELAAASSLVGRVQEIPVSEGFRLLEVEAPTSYIDRPLKELMLPQRHQVQVLLVRRPRPTGGDAESHMPRADLVIRPGDRLLVGGTPEAIREFKQD